VLNMAKIMIDVHQPGLISAYADGNFYEAKQALESESLWIISSEEDARLRIQEGIKAVISTNGNWVREGFICVPGKGIFLVRNSPIIDNALEATQCHKDRKEYFLSDEQAEKALADSANILKIPYDKELVPTNRFGDDERTKFLFKEFAQEYGYFLSNAGVQKMPIYLTEKSYVQEQKMPFARQAWLASIGAWSELCGLYYDSLGYNCRLRGIKGNTP
jgi:hypothetical protein